MFIIYFYITFYFFFQDFFPLFHYKTNCQSYFINDVFAIIEQLKIYPRWNLTEKNILHKVVSKFDVMHNSERSNYLCSII